MRGTQAADPHRLEQLSIFVNLFRLPVSNSTMKVSVRTLIGLLALGALLAIFLYPTIDLPATKLKRPLVLAAILLTIHFAGLLLLAIRQMHRDVIVVAPCPDVPLVDLHCSRLC
jgi:hypothetical protein